VTLSKIAKIYITNEEKTNNINQDIANELLARKLRKRGNKLMYVNFAQSKIKRFISHIPHFTHMFAISITIKPSHQPRKKTKQKSQSLFINSTVLFIHLHMRRDRYCKHI